MKKWLILSLLLSFPVVSFSEESLQAGISKVWTVDSARKEAFSDLKPWIDTNSLDPIDPNLIENKVSIKLKQRITPSHNFLTLFDEGLYAVAGLCQYTASYYSNSGRLLGIEYSSSSPYSDDHCSPVHPSKSYKYEYPSGKLISINLIVSSNESYTFDVDGTLYNHWIGNKCYEVDGKSCGTRKSFEEK